MCRFSQGLSAFISCSTEYERIEHGGQALKIANFVWNNAVNNKGTEKCEIKQTEKFAKIVHIGWCTEFGVCQVKVKWKLIFYTKQFFVNIRFLSKRLVKRVKKRNSRKIRRTKTTLIGILKGEETSGRERICRIIRSSKTHKPQSSLYNKTLQRGKN